jgi:hypothetical protein
MLTAKVIYLAVVLVFARGAGRIHLHSANRVGSHDDLLLAFFLSAELAQDSRLDYRCRSKIIISKIVLSQSGSGRAVTG